MKYYSQYQQDKILNELYFSNKNDGFFLDIGASDPEKLSNTLFFEEKGWSGVLVEPIKKDYENLIKARKTPVENVAIYKETGTFKFLLCDGPNIKVLSGLLHEQHPSHLQRIVTEFFSEGESLQIVNIPTITFEELLKKYNKTYVDYLSIDTEGSEYSILNSIDFSKFYIKCISVENNYNDTRIETLLSANKFTKIFKLGCDDIYVNQK